MKQLKPFAISGVILLLVLICSPCFTSSTPKEKTPANNGFLKSLFYEGNFKVPVYSFFEVPSANNKKHEIALSDGFSIEIIDAGKGTLVRKLEYPKPIQYAEIIDKEKNGHLEVLATGGGYADVGLFDLSGKTIWLYRPGGAKRTAPNVLKAGDLNGDGILEFYAATHDGLDQLNLKGEKIWRKEGWTRDLDIYNPGNGKLPMVTSLVEVEVVPDKKKWWLLTWSREKIQFRDYYGKLMNEFFPKQETVMEVENCEWPTPGHVLTYDEYSLYVYDFNGKLIFKYQPWNLTIFGIDCCAVKFNPDLPPYLAVIVRSSSDSKLSNLSIISPKGEIVYQETLNRCGYLLKIRQDSSKKEILLVGAGQSVWKYSLK